MREFSDFEPDDDPAHLASYWRDESEVDIESLRGQDGGPQAEHGVRGPAADLDQEQEAAHPGHRGLVLSEGDGPAGVRLLLLDLAHTLEEHGEPAGPTIIIICFYCQDIVVNSDNNHVKNYNLDARGQSWPLQATSALDTFRILDYSSNFKMNN